MKEWRLETGELECGGLLWAGAEVVGAGGGAPRRATSVRVGVVVVGV